MLLDLLLADLVVDLPSAVRLQRLVHVLREHFACGAVALLRLQGDVLLPVAVDGLVREALGRRFEVARHPRLAAILARREPTRFATDSNLPDPYDGLLEGLPEGEALPVHDCMGVSLSIEGQPWGVLTLDTLQVNVFDAAVREDFQRCVLLVEAAVRMTRLEKEVRALRISSNDGRLSAQEMPIDNGHDSAIIGHDAALQSLLREIDVIADSGLPVLLLGETGVGKELFARRLHQESSRSDRPLVYVNCAALPESLAESELFGHIKGAFSGATADRAGRFEAANGGTLFLDEVGELPMTVQAKLLRALQEGEVQRLGADEPVKVDVRIVAATNRNLQDGVRKGAFRADLYHRLSVYPLTIPPLRERGNDVLLIAGNFLELNRARLGLRSLRLSAAAEAALLRYQWPGNVRELKHVLGRAALKALSRGARREDIVTLEPEWLDLIDLPATSFPTPHAKDPQAASNVDGDAAAASSPWVDRPLREITDEAQRLAIRAALQASANNWSDAARRLELDASNLHKLAKRLGLK